MGLAVGTGSGGLQEAGVQGGSGHTSGRPAEEQGRPAKSVHLEQLWEQVTVPGLYLYLSYPSLTCGSSSFFPVRGPNSKVSRVGTFPNCKIEQSPGSRGKRPG